VCGDVGFFLRSLQSSFDRAQAQVASQFCDRVDEKLAHDVALIAGVALAMASLKMVKLLPGVPFAPGIKTVLLFPLYMVQWPARSWASLASSRETVATAYWISSSTSPPAWSST
jgi:hypothetical protein